MLIERTWPRPRRPRCFRRPTARSTRVCLVAATPSSARSLSASVARLLHGSCRSPGCAALRGIDDANRGRAVQRGRRTSRASPAPEQPLSYVADLVPSESSSGQKRRLGAITKTGSGHARRLLVEAALLALPPPAAHRARPHRPPSRPSAPQPADRRRLERPATRRLHRTWRRLETRAKRRTIIAVATARELAGFCWAITQIE